MCFFFSCCCFSFLFFSLLADGQEGQPEQRLPHRIRGLAAQTAEGKADAEGDGRVRTGKVSACCYRPPFGFFLPKVTMKPM